VVLGPRSFSNTVPSWLHLCEQRIRIEGDRGHGLIELASIEHLLGWRGGGTWARILSPRAMSAEQQRKGHQNRS
jgi:hypothetical protein